MAFCNSLMVLSPLPAFITDYQYSGLTAGAPRVSNSFRNLLAFIIIMSSSSSSSIVSVVFSGIIGFAMYSYTMYIFTGTIFFVSGLLPLLPQPIASLFFPMTLDGEANATMPTDLTSAITQNAVLLTIFALQHLIMARDFFKNIATRILPNSLERGLFCIAAAGSLHLLMLHWIPLPDIVWEVPEPFNASMMSLHMFGWIFVLLSTFMIDHFELFGLKQAFHVHGGATSLKKVGFYAFIRHPIMTGMNSHIFTNIHTHTMTLSFSNDWYIMSFRFLHCVLVVPIVYSWPSLLRSSLFDLYHLHCVCVWGARIGPQAWHRL